MTVDQVLAWNETITIPTYPVGSPNPNPMFLEKRVYQGSSGAVYPYPVIDRIYDEKEDRSYQALFLENRYLKIMILPELGGRVQMALDKTNQYPFVYYNQVIKPALVGLAGPWISGGIEFNWPQHHRPSTFAPLDWQIEAHPDGSQTVWCAEIERMSRTKGMHGFRLYPERAYLEINVQLTNRTDQPQTFLWWANPAVAVNDDYQSVFPPDVHAVMDHGKRDVSDFPIATGTYYKVNYAPGTDISRYKNIPVPTSYMAYHSDFDFVGCYDESKQAGMMHVANHHVVPGKKQWTWGCGDFGQAWDRQLTDQDGPYIELMCGAYTDNQPDFSWIQPGEEKRFRQVFMPYKEIGPAKNASHEAVLNLEILEGQARLGVYLTSARQVQVSLTRGQEILYQTEAALSPEKALVEQVMLPVGARPQELTLRVREASRELLSFTPLPDEKPAVPSPATPALPPEQIASSEELFLNGLHLEQYRHATYAPEPYYEEALRRDPGDSRCHTALGRLLYRRGQFAQAEAHFRQAVQRLTLRNPNPYDGEPYYQLGLALKMQARFSEAFDAFYKAIWNAAWQEAGYFELARLSSRAGRMEEALELLERALDRNRRHAQARHLKAALLRRLGQTEAALQTTAESLMQDPLEYGALWERFLLGQGQPLEALVRPDAGTWIELALDYTHAGLFADAAALLAHCPMPEPMVSYTLGWIEAQAGNPQAAQRAFDLAAALPPTLHFPNRLEDVLILEAAQRYNPRDARAPYALGNFWYAHRRYEEAIACWERARQLDSSFATVHRNLGLAYFNKRSDPALALESFETAFRLNPQDGRVLFELDQLYKKLNRSPQERLAFLEQHLEPVESRDDLTLERITLLNLLGQPEAALAILQRRVFHPWEGGEGKVTGQYVTSLILLAQRALKRGEAQQAVELLTQARTYPPNLGEGKLYGAQENNLLYFLGIAWEQLGEAETARRCFEQAGLGLSEPASAQYYNDQPPDSIFYQGLARRKLGQEDAARAIFQKLVDYGHAHRDDPAQMDYFAVSLPHFLVFDEDLTRRNRIHWEYMLGLGSLGLGDTAEAEAHFAEVLRLDAAHEGAALHRDLLRAG